MHKKTWVMSVAFLWGVAGALAACDKDDEEVAPKGEVADVDDEHDAGIRDESALAAAAAADYVRGDMQLTNEFDATRCECHPQDLLEEMGHEDSDECYEAAAIAEATIEGIGECVEESIRGAGQPAPSAVVEYFECGRTGQAAQFECIRDIRQDTDDICEEELEKASRACAEDAFAEALDCEDHLDDEAEAWLEREVDLAPCFELLERGVTLPPSTPSRAFGF